jgi:hypothetical protein
MVETHPDSKAEGRHVPRVVAMLSAGSWVVMGVLIACSGLPALGVGVLVLVTPLLAAEGIHVEDLRLNDEPVARGEALFVAFGAGLGLIVAGSALTAFGISRRRRASGRRSGDSA